MRDQRPLPWLKTRDRNTEENQRRHLPRFPFSGSGPERTEPERTAAAGRREYEHEHNNKHYYDEDRDDRLQELSQFSESLSRGESLSTKFQWENFLAEKPTTKTYANWGFKRFDDCGNDSNGVVAEKGYQESGFSGADRAVPKSQTIESNKAKTLPTYSRDYGASKDYRHTDGSFRSTLGKYDVGIENNEEIRVRDHSHLDDKPYKEREKTKFNTRDASTPSLSKGFATVSSSDLKDGFRGVYRDGMPYSSDGFGSSETIGNEGYDLTNPLNSYRYAEVRLKELAEFRWNQLSPNEDMDRDYKCSEVQRSEKGDMSTLPSDLNYKTMASVLEDYRYQDSTRTSIVEPIENIIDGSGSFYRHGTRESRVLDYQLSLGEKEKSIPNYPDLTMEQDEEVLGSKSAHFNCGTELYQESDMSTLPSDLNYKTMASVLEDCRYQDSTRTSIVEPIENIIDGSGSFYRHGTRESRVLDCQLCLGEKEKSIPNYPDLTMEQDEEVLGSKSAHFNCGTELYQESESLHFGGDNGFESDRAPWSGGDNSNTLPMLEHDRGLYKTDGSLLTAEELGMYDPSEKMLKRKRGKDKKQSGHSANSRLSHNWNESRSIYDLSYGNRQRTDSSMGLGYGQDQWNDVMHEAYSGDCLSSPNLPVSMQGHSSKPYKYAGMSIKSRLGPARDIPILNPFVKKHKPYKWLRRHIDYFSEGLHLEGGDHPKVKVKPAKTEPPEDSEEFKQLVRSAFLKFVKVLNENPAQRKKYTEQGGTGTLKCSICGSNSKEFVETLSLVMHAFNCRVAGSRADHLGFHKAICVLMGWNSAVSPNGAWVRQILPNAEALALKEDLIIWPPVLVIHNSSIALNNSNERLIVSSERLEALLRGMGFGGGKIKVYRGKPANQSIMVVKFNATFSGLREAEMVHKLYVENKHGRAEFEQIFSGCNNSSGETQKARVDKVESVLYGYLGIAGDLDKLDFEAKKRCVVRSKKEIQAIADAPL